MTSEIVWGKHPVLEALRAGRAQEIFVVHSREDARDLAEIRMLAVERGIPVKSVPAGELARQAGLGNAQNVAARVRFARKPELRDLLETPGQAAAFLLALDQVQDPQNFGALLRTADAAGVHGVIVTERRSAPLSGAVAAASAGAVSYVRVAQVTNLVRSLDELRRQALWTVGLDAAGETLLYDVDLTVPLVLVLGSEGDGLRRLTREHCDFVVRVPMLGHVGSLNVSASGAVAMYEVVRQRAATMRTP